MYTIYVTPAGYTCTCGYTQATAAGGHARREAEFHHTTIHAPMTSNVTIIDYRQIIADKDAQLVSNAQAMFEAGELCATLHRRLQDKQQLLDQMDQRLDELIARLTP
jgi:hypothetical protein